MGSAEMEGLAEIAAAAKSSRLEDLGGAPIEHLRKALGAASAGLYRYDADGAMEPLGGDLAAPLMSYDARLWRGDPTQQAPHRLPGRPRVVLPMEMVREREFHACEAYETFYRPHGIEHLLCLWLTEARHGAPGMAGIVLTRSADMPAFDGGEVTLGQHLLQGLSAIVSQLLRHQDLERLVAGTTAVATRVDAVPLAAVDEDGELVWTSSRAEVYLDRHRGAATLPKPVAAACRKLFLGPTASGVARFVTARGHRARAELTLYREEGRPPVVVVSFGATPSELPRQHGLTRAEWEVLEYLGRGLSNRENRVQPARLRRDRADPREAHPLEARAQVEGRGRTLPEPPRRVRRMGRCCRSLPVRAHGSRCAGGWRGSPRARRAPTHLAWPPPYGASAPRFRACAPRLERRRERGPRSLSLDFA